MIDKAKILEDKLMSNQIDNWGTFITSKSFITLKTNEPFIDIFIQIKMNLI